MTFDSTGSGDSDRSMETDSPGGRTETYSSWLLEAVAPPTPPAPAPSFRGVYDEAHPPVPVQVVTPPTGVPLGLILSGLVVVAVGVGIWAIATGRIDLGTTREILGLAPVERTAAGPSAEATTSAPAVNTSSAATPKRAGGKAGSGLKPAAAPAGGASSAAQAVVSDVSSRAALVPASDTGAPSAVERIETIRVHVTYDASDAAVIPPLIDMPEISARDRIRPVTSGAPAIEIVINERGTVDSARATVQPRTVGEAALLMGRLSAVKAWRFQPATKNGEAVRYRLLVPFDVD